MRKVNTRYPDWLHERLRQAAARARRSFNAEVLWRLERSFGQPGDDQETQHPEQEGDQT